MPRARHAIDPAESKRLSAMLVFERRLWGAGLTLVAGVDEVGMGPLAGPVLAAAVVLPPRVRIVGVDDSKRLTKKRREALSAVIRERAVAFAFGLCTVEEIDALNIYHAGLEAMRRAVAGLEPAPQHLLVDARTVAVPTPQTAIVKGDQRSHTIAAASIVAKVERDRIMTALAEAYPGFGFERHSGYPTKAHLDALARLGPTPIHRHSFAPVRALDGAARAALGRSRLTAC